MRPLLLLEVLTLLLARFAAPMQAREMERNRVEVVRVSVPIMVTLRHEEPDAPKASRTARYG